MTATLDYTADGRPIYRVEGRELEKFAQSRAKVQVIQGPVGCLSADTEFLTPFGWKAISVWDGDGVAEWEQATGEITFRQPLNFIDLPCEEMWHFENEHSLSMVLSDEHRCPVYDWSGNFRVKDAARLAAKPSRHTIPVSFSAPPEPGLDLTDDEIRLAVAIKADGCLPKRGSQCIVTVRKERKKERMRALLSVAGVEYAEHQHSTRDTELTFAFQRGGYQKGFDLHWWQASRQQLEIILAECLLWDGLADHEEQRYYTTIKGDADFIQYAAHATGRRATIGRYDDPRGPEWSPSYTVHITTPGSVKAKVQLRGDCTKIERVPAPLGRKYCFTTSTGFFVARHNGRIFITGNSGKSKLCNLKMWMIATAQAPARDGMRYTRFAVVRNTYPELRSTTMRTWTDTFPEDLYGRIIWSMPARQEMAVGDVRCGIDFLALDKDEDVKKLRSGEYTAFYVNELQYLPKSLFDEMTSRAGRYPAIKDGGPTWHGVIADMNAPDEDHFIAMMTGQSEWPLNMPEDEKAALAWPKEWDFFKQPPGLLEERRPDGTLGYRVNPEAENLKWLVDGYYIDQIKGKSRAWIKSRILNEMALVVDGSPVYPNFRPDYHVAREVLQPTQGAEVIVGIDPGRWPAAIFMQEIGDRVFVQHELLGFNEPATVFAPKVKRFLEKHYAGSSYCAFGDPKGFDREQSTDACSYDIYKDNGIIVRAPPGLKNNDIVTRVSAVSHLLDDNPSGIARFILSPLCRTTKIGLAGRYCLDKDETGDTKPTKNRYSHPANALEYGVLGMGEGRRMIGLTSTVSHKAINVRKSMGTRRRVA